MKKLFFVFPVVILCCGLRSQNVPNPYSSIGMESPKVVTLSNGEYDEFQLKESLVLINGDVVDRKTGELICSKEDNPEVVAALEKRQAEKFRFLSVDPLTKKYVDLSPYCYGANSPIRFTDQDGQGPEDRVKAAKQFLDKGYVYAQEGNTGRSQRTTFTPEALKKQDCVELVTRVLLADGVIHSMNVNKYDYYTAHKATLGVLLNSEDKFERATSPKIGDIAFWEGHTGIVSGVDEKTGTFTLIHAAGTKQGIVESEKFKTDYIPGFQGFYRPKEETPENKQIDITKSPVTEQPNVNFNQTPYVDPSTIAKKGTDGSADKATGGASQGGGTGTSNGSNGGGGTQSQSTKDGGQ